MPIGDLDIDIITRGETDDSDLQFDVFKADDVFKLNCLNNFRSERQVRRRFRSKKMGQLTRVEVSRKLKIL